MSKLVIETAEVFEPLLHPARYKGAHGGRGSGKSHFFAEKLIDDSLYEPGLLSVCIREVQKSLKDSAKRLIESKLAKFGLGEANGFRVFSDRIQTPGDGVIIFQGMQDHTAESIKSLEGFKRAWIEEGQTLSDNSLTLLRPTIRETGSEIWAGWNPRTKRDPVDLMFRGGNPPTGAVCVRATWADNPWFPDVLEQERLDCLANDPDRYDHIWEGEYAAVIDGAYYAPQIAEARRDGRVGHVAADPLMTIRAAWDIGGTGLKSDATAIWIYQIIGKEIRFLDYYEAKGQPLATHIAWLRHNGYEDALCILPHDGRPNEKVYKVSYESALDEAGFETQVIPNQGAGAAKLRIEAGRRLFPRMWFDRKCEPGLEALACYHERLDEKREIGLGPMHDWASHGADAFGLACVAHEEPAMPRERVQRRIVQHGWMG